MPGRPLNWVIVFLLHRRHLRKNANRSCHNMLLKRRLRMSFPCKLPTKWRIKIGISHFSPRHVFNINIYDTVVFWELNDPTILVHNNAACCHPSAYRRGRVIINMFLTAMHSCVCKRVCVLLGHNFPPLSRDHLMLDFSYT